MKFLRLSSLIINPSMINTIEVFPTKYTIHMTAAPIEGSILFASGGIQSSSIHLCQQQHPEDYEILSKWINRATQ